MQMITKLYLQICFRLYSTHCLVPLCYISCHPNYIINLLVGLIWRFGLDPCRALSTSHDTASGPSRMLTPYNAPGQ